MKPSRSIDCPDTPAGQSPHRYQGIFEVNPQPMLIIDLAAGSVLEANPAARRHFGREADEFAGLPIREIWSSNFPEDAMEGDDPEEACSVLSGHWLFRKKGGEKFDADVSCRLLDRHPSPVALILVDDITRQRRSAKFDAAISQLGQKLSEAATPTEAGRIIGDISRNLIGWDAFSVTLYSPETNSLVPVLAIDTVNGVSSEFFGYFHAGAPPSPLLLKVLKSGSRLILREEGDAAETTMPYGDTSRRSESLIFVPVKKGARSVGVISIQSYARHAYSPANVTTLEALASHCAGALERLRIESALRFAEQRFAQAFEASPMAMFIARYEDGRALSVNSAFLESCGFTREEVIGKTGLELGLWDNPRDRENVFETVRAGRQVRDWQLCFRTRTRELRHVLLSVEVIEVEEEKCLLFFDYDITERVNLEVQLRQSQKLESIGLVAAGVAHDFNNLLTVIEGCTSLVLANKRVDPESRDLLEQVSSSAARAANLTRQLLAFSSRQKMVPRQVSLNSLVRDLEKMLQQILGGSITLEMNCAQNLPLVSADAGMIEQVVVNMAVNARDAMSEGGSFQMETSEAPAGIAPPESPSGSSSRTFICLRLRDTGCGIAPPHLPRLFEPFYTTKELGKGSGLGLATAYGVVKQHGGWIDVRSRIGEGTEFTVFLPSCDEQTSEDAAEPSPPPAVTEGKERVLVVEDEPTVREMVCHILQFYGYETLQAESGPAALEVWKVHSRRIDAVVTDIVMPGGMDGREMARRLLEERPDLPVLYTSGYSPDVAGYDLVLEEGVNFLQKPFEAGALVRALRSRIETSAPA